MHNPLCPIILHVLKESTAPVNEYAILKRLEAEGLLTASAEHPDLALFQKHFLTMNALYQLQADLWQDEQLYLHISALEIYLLPVAEARGNTLPDIARDEALREYYLDWTHFNDADVNSVEALLTQFWTRLLNPDRYQAARLTLEITTDTPSKSQVRQQYRKLAALHHPDKGGETAHFIAIREAYELLYSACA